MHLTPLDSSSGALPAPPPFPGAPPSAATSLADAVNVAALSVIGNSSSSSSLPPMMDSAMQAAAEALCLLPAASEPPQSSSFQWNHVIPPPPPFHSPPPLPEEPLAPSGSRKRKASDVEESEGFLFGSGNGYIDRALEIGLKGWDFQKKRFFEVLEITFALFIAGWIPELSDQAIREMFEKGIKSFQQRPSIGPLAVASHTALHGEKRNVGPSLQLAIQRCGLFLEPSLQLGRAFEFFNSLETVLNHMPPSQKGTANSQKSREKLIKECVGLRLRVSELLRYFERWKVPSPASSLKKQKTDHDPSPPA